MSSRVSRLLRTAWARSQAWPLLRVIPAIALPAVALSTVQRGYAEGNGTMLDGRIDPFGGVNVESELPDDVVAFSRILRTSLEAWRARGIRGVWLKVRKEQAHLISAAVALGFSFHHAEESYLMLTHWLPAGPSPLPANASHQVGVGALVVNSKNQARPSTLRITPAATPFSCPHLPVRRLVLGFV